jgi:signal transduction histidine kinase
MMKKNRKLRRYITRFLGLAALVMIGVYSILAEYTLIKGLEEAASFDLRLTAKDISFAYQKDPHAPLPRFPRVAAYIGEKDLPGWFGKKFSPADLPVGTLVLDEPTDAEYERGQWDLHVILPSELHDGKRLYIIQSYTEKDDLPEAFIFSENLEIIILGTGIGFIFLLWACVRHLFRTVSSPLENLRGWAAKLDHDNLEQPHPDFHFEEINQLADLIQNAVGDLHQALNREHHFLRNASHELRTPIAVIRTNMDLLERLQTDSGDKEKISHQRIRRAVDSMHRLTETLLWLSRKEETMPPPEAIQVHAMVADLVEENRYLLASKDVDLTLDLEAAQATLPRTALHIALGNLVRNAFKYTGQGRIAIKVTPTAVTITNASSNTEGSRLTADESGFGLGLMLVEQICHKLNLSYESISVPGGRKTRLSLSHE